MSQGWILGALFLYIYINDLSDNVVSKLKLFTDDASMFSVVVDPINNSQKLSFKPDPSK